MTKLPNGDTRPVIGYYRVSDQKQVKNGVSLEAQQGAITEWVQRKGLAIMEWHHDDGHTAKTRENRPGFDAALARVCEIKGILVVYSISRMARNARDAIEISETLRKNGADLVMLDQNVDTSTPYGRLFFTIMAAMAQLESELKGASISLAMQHIKKSEAPGGGHVGKAPYGYRFDIRRRNQETGENAFHGLAEIPAEQAVIEKIRQWHGEGNTYREIIARLEWEKIPSRSGRNWSLSTLSGILRRRGAARQDAMQSTIFSDVET